MGNVELDGAGYAVLGRVLTALQEGDLRGHLIPLSHWRHIGGGWALEWRGGPFAREVVAELIRLDAGPADGPQTVRGLVDSDAEVSDTDGAVRIGGVQFSLRALEPVGLR